MEIIYTDPKTVSRTFHHIAMLEGAYPTKVHKYHGDPLHALGFLEVVQHPHNGPCWKLTPAGREALKGTPYPA